MAMQYLLLVTLIGLAYADLHLGGLVGKQSVLAPHSSKQALSCAAKFVDIVVLKEIELCANSLPIAGLVGVHGRKRMGDQLVTVTRQELLANYICLAQSGNRIAQKEFDSCFPKRPAQTLAAYSLCREKNFGGATGDEFYDIIAVKPMLMQELYECMRGNTVEYTHREAEQQASFEDCSRRAAAPICGMKPYP